MKIKLKEITVEDLVYGFKDLGEDGVFSYAGKLDIRPPYQRELVYKEKEQKAVIDTLTKGLPLNVMYWSSNEDKTYELLDGQQRTMSICRFVKGKFSDNEKVYFHNYSDERRDQVLNYKLMIYVCEGTYDEKLDWFEIINIAGKKLTDQELLNAMFVGPWLSDAKEYFSGTTPPGYRLSKDVITSDPLRQGLLEKILKWKADGEIKEYMAAHQKNSNADELIEYFESMVGWIKDTFEPRKEMKAVDWGLLYENREAMPLVDVKSEVTRLMLDDEVTKKSGIYPYLVLGDGKYLNLRAFTENQKIEAFERQGGICPITNKKFDSYSDMHADHIIPWSKGGKTSAENLQMLDPTANMSKSDK